MGYSSRVMAAPWLPVAGVLAAIAILVAGLLRPNEGTIERPQRALADSANGYLLVYVGGANCVWSNAPEMRSLLDEARRAVATQASSRGLEFSSLGIAKDTDAERGLEHLASMGGFDAVSAGGGWLGAAPRRYVTGEFGGVLVTPQLLIVEQELKRKPYPEVVAERILHRSVGLDEIERWVRAGAAVHPIRE